MTTTEHAPATGVRDAVRGSRGRTPLQRVRRGAARWWFAYAMLTPVALVMGALVLWPLVRGILLSFTDADRYSIGNVNVPASYDYVWLENYVNIVTSSEFRGVLAWTGIWTFVNVFFHFSLGLGLAVMLNRAIRARGLYRVLLIVPWAVPSFISIFAWRFLFNTPYGFFDQALAALGIDGPAWLGDPTWARVAAIMTNVWMGIPFMVVALLGALQAIDGDLLDAAAVDGASPWRRFWDVTLPGIRPVAATVVLLGIIWTFNLFANIFLLTGGGPGISTQILVTFAYREAFDLRQFGNAAAYGVIILSMLLVFAGGYIRVLRRMGEETWT